VQERPAPDLELPMDALPAQYDVALRSASDTVVTTALAWHALFRAYVDVFDAGRRAYGGLLVDWHQRYLHSGGDTGHPDPGEAPPE